MAKSQLNYKRTITDKVQVKGRLSEDTTTITYTDENDIEQTIKIADVLKVFGDKFVDIAVSLKSEEELDLNSDSNDEND